MGLSTNAAFQICEKRIVEEKIVSQLVSEFWESLEGRLEELAAERLQVLGP
jgi:hypothetical protein